MNNSKRHPDATNVMDHAYLSQADRYNLLLSAVMDPHVSLNDKQSQTILKAAEAIEQEWLVTVCEDDEDLFS